jgi:Tol biopolymer transport system component
MFKKPRIVLALFLMIALSLACANPMGGTAPGNVETIVAATLQALTVTVPAPQDAAPGLLPHALYFLNNDSAGLAQVFRLDKDGKTVTQLTFEPVKVDSYDVSRLDGSVVYVSNNQMLMVNADGGNRRLLLDGGAVDENNPYVNNVSFPVFSPDNQTIAFGHGGLRFYSVATGQSSLILENVFDDFGGGLIPRELHWPESYSADGTKLLISIAHYEGATAAIYYPNGGALVRLNGGDGASICCGDTEWTADGSAFYAANPTTGMFNAGLWRVDATTGDVTTLLTGSADTDPIPLPDEPFPAPDGQLYYFFASMPNAAHTDFSERSPLQLVRSAADGITNRTVLRPETYEFLNETLWAADASFVIAAVASIREIYQGGEARLVYTDGQKGVVTLLPFAMNMKWGP